MSQTETILSLGFLSLKTKIENGAVIAEGPCITRLRGAGGKFDSEKVRVDTRTKEDAVAISFASRHGISLPGGMALNRCRLSIDIEDAADWDIQNKLRVRYDGEGENRISYSLFDGKNGKNKTGEIFIMDGNAMYFRQNKYNSLCFTIRDVNQYDTAEGQERIRSAKKRSAGLKDKDIILMYEKHCARFEESASVLYKRLIDMGYDNVYYIADSEQKAVQNLDDKYKKNIIEKDSDKHLEYFFASKKFVSTETIDHAMQLRASNKEVQDKYVEDGLMYVFLQHGVMYMVSLDSSLRSGFRKKQNFKLHKTVVSSEAEANHFIELAEMDRDDLYITGLAKFDESYRHSDADKIIIMPTWRRWETNQAKHDIRHSGYYKMIERMYNSVPDKLKDKVVILPHPLMAERFAGEKDGIGGHILLADSYDEVLRDCSLLITDYSSIAYDAFYRGANVIFCWEEKDECMQYYGEEAHLMLNEDNAFGPITTEENELNKAIEKYYGREQDEAHIKRYRGIVEFHDGRNTERIIECMKKDGLLK